LLFLKKVETEDQDDLIMFEGDIDENDSDEPAEEEKEEKEEKEESKESDDDEKEEPAPSRSAAEEFLVSEIEKSNRSSSNKSNNDIFKDLEPLMVVESDGDEEEDEDAE